MYVLFHFSFQKGIAAMVSSCLRIVIRSLQFLGTCREQSGSGKTSSENYLPGSTSGKTSPGNCLPPGKPLPGTTYLRENLSRELPTSGRTSRSTPEVVSGQGQGEFPLLSHLFPGIAVTRSYQGWGTLYRQGCHFCSRQHLKV